MVSKASQFLALVTIILSSLGCQAFVSVNPQSPLHASFHKKTTLLPSSHLVQDAHSVVVGQNVIYSLFQHHGNVPFHQALSINVILFAMLRSKLLKMLTLSGYLHALALGTGLWTTLGWRGWTLCVAYLIFGQAVTKLQFAEKERQGIAEGRGGRRGPENVWGSAATALVCAFCSVQGTHFLGISSQIYLLGFVSSLSTKLADTFASEIGKAYGKKTYLITTLQRVDPGTEGGISTEGTVASILGGLILSVYGYAIRLIPARAIPISVISSFVACNVESLMGATLQRSMRFPWATNEVVNIFNTLFGAMLAMLAGTALL